jgi:hypothetical protein
MALHRAGHGDVAASLLQAEFRIPELQILVFVTNKHENAAAFERPWGHTVGMHDGALLFFGWAETEAGCRAGEV